MEAERDALKTELAGQKQEAAEQLAAANAARDVAAAELADASKQLQAAQANVQRLQGRVSEVETAHERSQGAHAAASKSLTAAQVGVMTIAFFSQSSFSEAPVSALPSRLHSCRQLS